MPRVGYGYFEPTRTRTRPIPVPVGGGYGYRQGTGILLAGTGTRGYTRDPRVAWMTDLWGHSAPGEINDSATRLAAAASTCFNRVRVPRRAGVRNARCVAQRRARNG